MGSTPGGSLGGCCSKISALGPLTHLIPFQDLLKHTPADHPDYPLLQDALRISQNFLSSINEDIDPRRTAVTTPKGEVSQRGGQCLGSGRGLSPLPAPGWCLHPGEHHGVWPRDGGFPPDTVLGARLGLYLVFAACWHPTERMGLKIAPR